MTLSTEPPTGRLRQPILYADQLWRQQRFFAGFLVAVGAVMTVLLIYQGQIAKSANVIWLLYIPSGLLLGGAFLLYKRRSYVEAQDAGVKIGTLRSSVLIDYDRLRGVADAGAWEVSSRLPDRLGQNRGGGKLRKRRR